MMTVESSSSVWIRNGQRQYGMVVALLAAALAAGCGGVPKTRYYTLNVPAAPAPSDPKTSYVLGIDRFRSPAMLRDDRIVYYLSTTEVSFYQYHRWGSDPATLLSEFTAQWLRSSGAFSQIRMLPSRERVDYVLGGNILDFEEVDSGGTAKARLDFTLALVRSRDGKLVWSGEKRMETPISEGGVAGVVAALNAACAQGLGELAPGLIAQVEQDAKSSGQ